MESEELNDGILIQLLSPNSPLLSAGCKRGDIIKQVNGKPIHSITQGDVKSWTNQNLEIQYSREGNLKTAIVKSFQPVYYTVYRIEGDGELVKSLFSSRVSKEISIERE
jgi:S1-C subfamily serine protease